MPRKNRQVKETLSKEIQEYFESGITENESLDLYILRTNKNQLLATWTEHKEKILQKWIKDFPGYRPYIWWLLDAPETRKRIGGIGKTSWEVGNSVKPIFYKGIPSDWSCVINGKIILRNFDKGNPPLYESEAETLRRYGLLTPTEEKILADNPETFEPVSILDIFDFVED